MRKSKGQSTVEYLLLIGALVLAVLGILSKGGIAKRIAKVYDSSGQLMSKKVGRTNSGLSLEAAVSTEMGLVEEDKDSDDPDADGG